MSVWWNLRFYLKLTSCPSVELLLPLCSCLGFFAVSTAVLIPGVTLSAAMAFPCLVCSQGTLELSFFLRSSFYWLLATRIEWEELCFIMSLYTLPSVEPWSLSNILKKKQTKTQVESGKDYIPFESNRKFIQLLLNTLDEMLSYRFLLVSACIQLTLFTAFWYIPQS